MLAVFFDKGLSVAYWFLLVSWPLYTVISRGVELGMVGFVGRLSGECWV